MAEEKTLFEKLYEVGEENLARFAEEVISNPAFSDTMDQTYAMRPRPRERLTRT
jgi:predicted nucleotidyltransferase